MNDNKERHEYSADTNYLGRRHEQLSHQLQRNGEQVDIADAARLTFILCRARKFRRIDRQVACLEAHRHVRHHLRKSRIGR